MFFYVLYVLAQQVRILIKQLVEMHRNPLVGVLKFQEGFYSQFLSVLLCLQNGLQL
jgi:hypothetical protein